MELDRHGGQVGGILHPAQSRARLQRGHLAQRNVVAATAVANQPKRRTHPQSFIIAACSTASQASYHSVMPATVVIRSHTLSGGAAMRIDSESVRLLARRNVTGARFRWLPESKRRWPGAASRRGG